MKIKDRLLIFGTVLLGVACVGTGTVAYFTAQGKAHNVITTGGIHIKLIEQRDENGTLVDFPEEGIGGVMPGTSASKIVSVQNTGTNDAWIRVRVDWDLKDPQGTSLPDTLYAADGTEVDVISFTVNAEHWLEGDDGYYYYREPVPANEENGGGTTEILFDEVHFAKEMDNRYMNCTSNVIVEAQAVQVANNPIPDGGDVTGIKGWPENTEVIG